MGGIASKRIGDFKMEELVKRLYALYKDAKGMAEMDRHCGFGHAYLRTEGDGIAFSASVVGSKVTLCFTRGSDYEHCGSVVVDDEQDTPDEIRGKVSEMVGRVMEA